MRGCDDNGGEPCRPVVAVLDASQLFAEVVTASLRSHGLRAQLVHQSSEDQLPPDAVVIVDADGPAAAVTEDVRHLRAAAPATRVLLLVRQEHPAVAQLVRQVGADGWVTRQLSLDSLVLAISDLMQGRRPGVDSTTRPASVHRVGTDGLTVREIEVLEFLGAGNNDEQVAIGLSISVNTVRTHLQNIRAKLGVGTRLAAVVAARRAGLLATPGTENGETA
jgi:DNA-binding NarL/FixJ family response regulator